MSRPHPTNHEKSFGDDEVIVSKTDTKSNITYCNEIFIKISGYEEEELLGKPHNILRHPDMPRAVFKLLWERIQAGKEIHAYVKNICKDGSFYWVLANVTPSFDEHDNIIGYFSVRTKPTPEAIATISELYAKMLQIEKTSGMNASAEYLQKIINDKETTYEEFILSL